MMLKDTLLYLSQNERVHDFVVQNPLARGASRRFVAGENIEDAIMATRELNNRGVQVALDYLGENISSEQEARDATKGYLSGIDLIKRAHVNANISIKLTALGLDVSQQLCEENLTAILELAQKNSLFVCIDMESSEYTDRTVDITVRMHKQFEYVGTVIQSCLYRSKKDIEQLIAEGVRVRLVKGAYSEPQNVAYQSKSSVDHNYVQLMTLLLARGNYPAIATHDETIINAACKYVRDHGIGKDAFEFQMLYGIRRDMQENLVRRGYDMRVYVPYGSQWYPYLMRRMAERPANLMFVLSNVLR
jgi:proline dehydrogenase